MRLQRKLSQKKIKNPHLQSPIPVFDFQNPQVQNWFSDDWEVLAERRLLRNRVQFIPDRVLVKDNQAIVIDYKTGQKESKHLKQVNNYAQILEGMGYRVMEKYLLYVGEEMEIVEVN